MDNIVMTRDEQMEIVEWANKNYVNFKINGPGRQYECLDIFDDIPDCVWKIKERVIEKESLGEYRQEPKFRDYIGYIINGGQIHPHKDPNDNDDDILLIHTRFNVFVQLPLRGGMPIYGNKKIGVKELEYIRCLSGLETHYCQKVEGEKARIILSFGFLIPRNNIIL